MQDRPPPSPHIHYAVESGIATITLSRPERLNAFTRGAAATMIAAVDRVDADDGVRAVVVTGAGRAFCAGVDLSKDPGNANFVNQDRTDAGALQRDWGAW